VDVVTAVSGMEAEASARLLAGAGAARAVRISTLLNLRDPVDLTQLKPD
jgi:hypothetical protein